MKLIDLHKEWCESGTMGEPQECGGGLCYRLPYGYENYFDRIKREAIDFETNAKEGLDTVFWASGFKKREVPYKRLAFEYTPMRQTIVLLICAMNNEL